MRVSGESIRQQAYLGGVCFITDRCSCELTCLEMCRMVLEQGVQWVQYRDKERSRLEIYCTSLALRKLTSQYGAFFVVNDHPDIAASVGADGVHLGQEDMPVSLARKIVGDGLIIGVSTHNITQARAAEADGADYIGFGPVYATATKAKAGTPKGTEMLKKVIKAVHIPVVAIGGIDLRRATSVYGSGAHALAVASAILKGDVCQGAKSFQRCAQGALEMPERISTTH